MKKVMLLGSLLLFMVSCETDSLENTSQDVIGYKYTSESLYDDPALPDYKRIVIGNLTNGKLFSETSEIFYNNVGLGSSTEQKWFYSNDRLSMSKGTNIDIYYYYDTAGNLIGATGVMAGGSPPTGGIYERYAHQPNNIVYCERINLPYDDPSAVVNLRYILQRNVDGEVIAAGRDSDYNGVMDFQYLYTYNDGDMTSMQSPDGTIVTFNYSNVIDTFSHLQELSYGKQVLQFPCSSIFATGNIQGFSVVKYSKHVRSDELLLQNYQVLPSNFYFKRNVADALYLPDGTRTEEMEYFFN